ncbi:hypothetical protein E2320_013976 [Naja naja]|nr:hypothetical protein E2320_013976 [Naja naja]
MAPPPPSKGAAPTKPHRPKSSLCPAEGKREVGPGPRSGGEAPSAPNRYSLENKATPDPNSPPSLLGTFMASRPSLGESGGQSPSGTTKPKGREMLPAPSKGLPPKTLGASLQAAHPVGKAAKGGDACLPKEEEGSAPAVAGADRGGPVAGEDLQPRTIEATVCAKNIKLSSTGEKVVLWTREADRVILTSCQERGADPQTFSAISEQLGNKTPEEVAHRFRELMTLFHTACDVSSDDDEDGMSVSHADQLSDKDPALSEDEREETGF